MLDAIRTAVRFRPSPQKVTTEAVLVPEWLMGWIANPLFVSSILTQHSRGYSSIGRALGLQPRGRRFDSYYLHADVKKYVVKELCGILCILPIKTDNWKGCQLGQSDYLNE